LQIEQNRPRLYRIAYAWCQDYHVAEDLAQEALEKSLKYADQLKQEGLLNVWQYRILNNCWMDFCRRHRDSEELDTNSPSTSPGPQEYQIAMETVRVVRLAVADLPPGFRQALTLVDLEGFSYMETAQILDVPVGTVTSRIARARKRLRDILVDTQVLDQQISVPKIRRIK